MNEDLTSCVFFNKKTFMNFINVPLCIRIVQNVNLCYSTLKMSYHHIKYIKLTF